MKSSLATRKLAVETNAGASGAGILHLPRPFHERRNPERTLGNVPINGLLGSANGVLTVCELSSHRIRRRKRLTDVLL
jgi:hypothetical protein